MEQGERESIELLNSKNEGNGFLGDEFFDDLFEDLYEEIYRPENERPFISIIENESGVRVRNRKEIEDLLSDLFEEIKNNVRESLRFRDDIIGDNDSYNGLRILYRIRRESLITC